MGVVFFVVFLLLLLGFGAIFSVVSLVFLILLTRKKRAGMKHRKLLITVCSVILGISLIVTAVPIGCFAFTIFVNVLPPHDYVDTGIVIAEDGYQSERFTANGTVYEALDMSTCHSNVGEAVFSYKKSGFLNGSQCGNYYRVENPHGFDLVCDRYDNLYCPAENAQKIKAYYDSGSTNWYMDADRDSTGTSYSENTRVDDELAGMLDYYYESPLHRQPVIYDRIEESVAVYLYCSSSDNVVLHDIEYLEYSDGRMYVSESTFTTDDGRFMTKVTVLPEELEQKLLDSYYRIIND